MAINLLVQMINVIAFVGDGGGASQAIDKLMRMGDIVFLSGTANQPDGITQGISSGMDFRAQTAAGAAKALGMRAPFLRRAPAAC